MKKYLVLLFAMLLCLGLVISCASEPKLLAAITVSQNPDKTVYYTGESLDTTGMKIELNYSDGSKKTVTSGFTYTPQVFGDEQIGKDTEVTISYVEGNIIMFTTLKVEVKDAKPYMLKKGLNWTNNFSIFYRDKFMTGEITEIHFVAEKPEGITSEPVAVTLDDSTDEVAGYFEGTKIYIVGKTIFANVNSSYAFSSFDKLEKLELSNLNTSLCTTMSQMIYHNPILEELDLSGFDTSKVTDLSYMFGECTNLASLDLSSFDTKNVIFMSSMFSNCSNLETVIFGDSFHTENVLMMDAMFSRCTALTSLDLSDFDTSNVVGMDDMFYECSSLASLDLSRFNTENVTRMDNMFFGCQKLKTLTFGTNFDTGKVTTMADMFYNCQMLEDLDLSGFNTENVTAMSCMFFRCQKLKTLSFGSNFDTGKVTTMGSMFVDCSALQALDLSGFKTENVKSMYSMFDGCSALTSLDLSSFNTENVTEMDYMFRDCSALTSLDLSSFNTEKMKENENENMFTNCNNLTSLKIALISEDEETNPWDDIIQDSLSIADMSYDYKDTGTCIVKWRIIIE